MGIYLQKFCKITAIWARVAVPRGDRVWVPVPEIRPLPTAHYRAWGAQALMVTESV